jgi:hypothetical protein
MNSFLPPLDLHVLPSVGMRSGRFFFHFYRVIIVAKFSKGEHDMGSFKGFCCVRLIIVVLSCHVPTYYSKENMVWPCLGQLCTS